MSQKRGGVIQNDDVESLAGHFAPEPRRETADRLASVLTGQILGYEHRDIEIAVRTLPSPCATPKEKPEPDFRYLG